MKLTYSMIRAAVLFLLVAPFLSAPLSGAWSNYAASGASPVAAAVA